VLRFPPITFLPKENCVPVAYSLLSSGMLGTALVSRWLHILPATYYFSTTLKMEAACSSETSVTNRWTRRHIPEDCSSVKTPNHSLQLRYRDVAGRQAAVAS
jgi:hypothetical protein